VTKIFGTLLDYFFARLLKYLISCRLLTDFSPESGFNQLSRRYRSYINKVRKMISKSQRNSSLYP